MCKLRITRFWGYFNWCLTPALYFGKTDTACWLKVVWLRGDVGLKLSWHT